MALGSQLLASLVSFQATAETTRSKSIEPPPSTQSGRNSAPKACGGCEDWDAAAASEAPNATPSLSIRPRAAMVLELAPPVIDTVEPSDPIPVYVDGADDAQSRDSRFANASTTAHTHAPVFHRATKDTYVSNPQAAQRRLLGWIMGSLGLAGIGIGATTALAFNRKDPLDRQCADPIRICSPDGKASPGSMTALSAAGWAIGVLGVTTGTVLILTNNPKTGRETALGTDFYRGGAGLKVSRNW
ncbi:MAG TPA: hypothetical protein VH062_29060 [Polyangiaceae bacterium]|nr:hypothetical protein [Polyangiaceae bacterium]